MKYKVPVIGVVLCMLASHAWAQMPASTPIKMQVNTLFIVDSSNSMWGEVGGKPKYRYSQSVLDGVMRTLPPDAQLALMAYGHRSKTDCNDVQLISPLGSHGVGDIKQMVAGLAPKGTTPLASALAQSFDVLKDAKGAKMVVLITDGGEECGGDPCEVARQLLEKGMVVRVNVVGFTLSEKEKEQLQCVAREGGGRYFDVQTPAMVSEVINELNEDVATYVAKPNVPVAAPSAPTPARERKAVNEENLVPLPESPEDYKIHDLLSLARGGVIARPDDRKRWQNSVIGAPGLSSSVSVGQEVVFSFKNGKAATFSQFEMLLPEALPHNVQSFELKVSDALEGPYKSIGVFTTSNMLSRDNMVYQTFKFDSVTARFLSFKVLSNYGGESSGNSADSGDTKVHQLRLMGKLN